MSDKKSIASVSDESVNLLQSIFANNEKLLKLIRKAMFGLDLSKDEKETLRGVFINKELVKVFNRRFCPSYLDEDTAIGQTLDLWAGVEVRGQTRDAIQQSVMARKLLIEMTKQGLSRLENPDVEGVDLSYDPVVNSADALHVRLIVRNSYLNNVETQLSFIKVISEQNNLTTDELKKKILKDSAK